MEESDYEAELRWYCLENYYNGMATRARDACTAYPENDSFLLISGIAYALIGRTNDCVEQVSRVVGKEDSTLAALLVQSIAYRLNCTRDRTNLSQIDTRIREERRRASAFSLAQAASVLFLFKKIDKAKEYADRAYKINPSDKQVLLIAAWIYLYLSKDDVKQVENARDLFASVLKESPNELGILLGYAKLHEYNGEHEEAISMLNRLIVRYPKLSIPLNEKMRNQLATKNWEETMDTADRIISIEPNSIDSIKAKAVVTICRDGLHGSDLMIVKNLFRNLFIAEPNNVDLILDNIQLFSRITNRDMPLLLELSKITEKTIEQNSTFAGPMVELGNLYVLMGKLTEADHWYRSALRIDESSFNALTGLANCQILESAMCSTPIELARQQLDFLMELESKSVDPRLLLMSAKINANEPNKALNNLARAVTTILELSSRNNSTYGYQYLKDLNPSLSLDIIKEYLVHSPSRFAHTPFNNSNGEKFHHDNDNNDFIVCELLEKIADACPSMGVTLVMLAKVRMQAGHIDEALATLRKLLDTVDPSNPVGHLLHAQILTQQAQYEAAAQSLEVGLSYNFRVRDDPIYHLISSIIEKEAGDLEACVASLQLALTLVNGTENEIATPISTSDKATLYLELVSAYGKLKKFHEASALIEEAKGLFANSLEEPRILIANSQLSLEMGDVDKAIKCLISVVPGKPYYVEARTTLARIYLDHRKDRDAFAKCFRFSI